jgi:hypothetical protein
VDTGANDLLNFPDVTLVRMRENYLIISWSVNQPMGKVLRIEFFAGPRGYGEGLKYLGFVSVAMGGDTDLNFAVALPNFRVEAGDVITATATDELGNTSFSRGAYASRSPVTSVRARCCGRRGCTSGGRSR